MSNYEVIDHHVVFGSKIVPTATLYVLVDGEKKQVASAGRSPVDALHQALFKAFGYRVDNYVIEGPLDGPNGEIQSGLNLFISGNGKRYEALERFSWDPERSKLYEATIAVYLKALREQKQFKLPIEVSS